MKHDIIVPSPGESINEVYIGSWHKQSGDIVKKDEVLVELESQKATFELQAEFSGKLEIIKSEEQEAVAVGAVVATIDDSFAEEASLSGAGSTMPEKDSKPQAKIEPIQVETNGDKRLSPAVRKLIAEKNLDPNKIKGSGKGGRILKEDVFAFERNQSAQPTASSTISSPSTSGYKAAPMGQQVFSYEVDAERGEQKRPASRLRRQIADNLVAAQHTAAILTTFNEVDMSSVMAFRKKYKDKILKKHDVKIGMVGFFALAAVRALKEFKHVNATYTGEDIIFRDFVDLSIAVNTERGLVVPVLRDIDKMGLIEFEKALADIAERARDRKLSIPEMTGGTFTITNGGVFGSLLSTPILNMPQSGILGLHSIQERPVAVKGQVVIRPMMYIALSYDHRIIDGREAVSFLVRVKEGIEDLNLMVDEKKL